MESRSRIGSACWYLGDANKGNESRWKGGRLLAWSTDFEDLPQGVALFPVAVIEDDKTGTCHSVYATKVCFASVPPAGK